MGSFKIERSYSVEEFATDECPTAQDASRIRDVSEIQTPLPRAQARELMRDVPHPDDLLKRDQMIRFYSETAAVTATIATHNPYMGYVAYSSVDGVVKGVLVLRKIDFSKFKESISSAQKELTKALKIIAKRTYQILDDTGQMDDLMGHLSRDVPEGMSLEVGQ